MNRTCTTHTRCGHRSGGLAAALPSAAASDSCTWKSYPELLSPCHVPRDVRHSSGHARKYSPDVSHILTPHECVQHDEQKQLRTYGTPPTTEIA